MAARDPITRLVTHEVTNQAPPLEGYNAYQSDAALKDAVEREGGAWGVDRLNMLGELVGSAEFHELARAANRHPPELRTHDRYGRRIDEVEFHPAYHRLMELGISLELPSIAWTMERGGSHVVHAALAYLFHQVEQGVGCPLAMTYAAIPSLRRQPEVAGEWEPRLLSSEYDPRCIPAAEKRGATIGMAMTEKQGGSDVRSNATRATPLVGSGPGAEYTLTGHKWFCSAPMSDAFLTLAHTDQGLSCFLVPRWRPDGTRNPFHIQRLKDKLGDRSNASSEIEYQGTWARMVGEEGRGVRAIMDMVHHTRLECSIAPAALMRQGLSQAVHHATHRSAFGRNLIEHELMQQVLGDLALESEAATALALRVARAFDDASGDEGAAAFARLAVAVSKYWLNKRVTGHVVEAMECLGGAGYVEESILPRLYRQAPLNGIWEGSGNVICLDVLRTLNREPEVAERFFQELSLARGGDARLDRAITGLERVITNPDSLERVARRVVELMALALQGALLVQYAPESVADAFCASRLDGDWGLAYGTLPPGAALDALVERARPRIPQS
jgi:putative acyl-CoA dehydrogenase